MFNSRFAATLVSLGMLGGILLGATTVAPADAEARSPTDGFSIVVTTTATGIAASCEEGCAWRRVAAEFPANQYDVTSEGILRAVGGAPVGERGTFSIRIAVGAEGGIRARCHHGCVWGALSGTYPGNRYRVTDTGIEPPRLGLR